jgi:5'(3')-deoxyribonucleotidase
MDGYNLPTIRRPKVALDVDGTIANPHAVIVEEWNRITGKDFRVSDIDNYDWSISKLQMPMEEFFRIYENSWNERTAEIRAAVTEQELVCFAKYFDVDIVTQRSSNTKTALQKWLKHNFPSLDLKTILVEQTSDKLKADYDIIIDDAPKIWRAFHQNDPLTYGKWLYAPKQPWNSKVISSMFPSPKMASVNAVSNAFEMALSEHTYSAKTGRKKECSIR